MRLLRYYQVGMMVTCCESYEDINKGDIGQVIKVDNDGLHDLNVFANWQRKAGNYWVRFVHVELSSDSMTSGKYIAAVLSFLL